MTERHHERLTTFWGFRCQRLFVVRDIPTPPEGFRCLGYAEAQQLEPRVPGEEAGFVVRGEWSWSPTLQRVTDWDIGTDESGRYWLLWASHETDDFELAPHCDPDDDEGSLEWQVLWLSEPVAACLRQNVDIREAAIHLLKCAWAEERDSEVELDRPHVYGGMGLLDIGTLRTIEMAVWGSEVLEKVTC